MHKIEVIDHQPKPTMTFEEIERFIYKQAAALHVRYDDSYNLWWVSLTNVKSGQTFYDYYGTSMLQACTFAISAFLK